jgi:hypothetical protein
MAPLDPVALPLANRRELRVDGSKRSCSFIALFSFAAAPRSFHGQYRVRRSGSHARSRAPREPALQERGQDHFKRLEAAVQSGDAGTVESEHKALISASTRRFKGRLHRNTAARKKSRATGIVRGSSQPQAQG